MKPALMTVRGAGTVSLILGLIMWSGSAPAVLVPLHMLIGIILVVALVAAALLGLRSGVSGALVIGSIVWAVLTPLLGVSQQGLLPGDQHILIQVAHLVMGLAAIGLGEAIGAQSRRRGVPKPA